MMSLLESPRLKYEKLSLIHVTDRYLSWINDPVIRIGLESVSVSGPPSTMDDLKNYVGNLDQKAHVFAIIWKESHIGNIKIHMIEPKHGRAEIGYLIGDRSVSGMGFGTEAVGRITRYCFENLDLRKVTAGCYADNMGSIRILEKNGYLQEGHLKFHIRRDGEYIDVLRFGKLKP